MEDLLLRARCVVRTSKMKISRRRLSNCVKICTKKRAARTARLFFLFQRQRRCVDALIGRVLANNDLIG